MRAFVINTTAITLPPPTGEQDSFYVYMQSNRETARWIGVVKDGHISDGTLGRWYKIVYECKVNYVSVKRVEANDQPVNNDGLLEVFYLNGGGRLFAKVIDGILYEVGRDFMRAKYEIVEGFV